MTAPATMQSEAMWAYLPLAGERSGAVTEMGSA
jgi:hypothetical protein